MLKAVVLYLYFLETANLTLEEIDSVSMVSGTLKDLNLRSNLKRSPSDRKLMWNRRG